MIPKTVTLLGATGSIGENTLEVIRQAAGQFPIHGLSARRQVGRLLEQTREFQPKRVVLSAPTDSAVWTLSEPQLEIGEAALSALAADGADILVNALVGAVGIRPTYEAARTGKRIALANKESLVAAGDLINREAAKSGAEIIPIDSEHSAIFQCLDHVPYEQVEKVILTASGGPFRTWSADKLADVTVEQALNHPTWKMGTKITIDSATMMNKGLEVIEAHFLFGVPYDRIEVVIHPQSVVHSMVQFVDGSILAQLGTPDMRIPIQYALTYPEKRPVQTRRLDLGRAMSLDFAPPDLEKFPCIGLAYEAGRQGGSLPAVMNAANEVAVEAFLKGRVTFRDIPNIIRQAMKGHRPLSRYTLEEILDVDRTTREEVMQWVL
ncbi:MAG: 1-deoxy-D-xylulose-5-phosphate reductoisomerase [Elusimicrobia bacterium RIFOXYB2_FULL_49_7]|nr:MAG: 1-deoxy-D-xylulose-5-phosphate reductoisomerase [Elusimicrobia bacterium RIFOXYB2_FULL_49_7]